MLSRLYVALAIQLASLLFLTPSAQAAYFAFYEDYVSYGYSACNATDTMYEYEAVNVDLLDPTVLPVGWLPVIRNTIDATYCTDYDYCYGPNSGTIFNVTAIMQCSPVVGSTTLYNLTVTAFEGPVANDVDANLSYATTVQASTLSTLATSFQITAWATASGAFDECVQLNECYSYDTTDALPDGPYPNLWCNNDLLAQFSCNSAIYPAAASVDPPTGVFGDPQLYGLLGQSFQVHGIDGGIYNLISAASLQLNTQFVFLDSAHCPAKSVVNTPCWTHPGSYMGALSLQAALANGEVVRITITAGQSERGLQAVQVNNVVHQAGNLDLQLGASAEVSVVSRSTHSVHVHTALFDIDADNSDGFINLRLKQNVPLSQLKQAGVHGLLGQTHSKPATTAGALKEVEGEVDDYFVVDGLLGVDFMYNRFSRTQ